MEEFGKVLDFTLWVFFKFLVFLFLKEIFRISFVFGVVVFFGIVNDGGGFVIIGDGGWMGSFFEDVNLFKVLDFNFGVRKLIGRRVLMVLLGFFFKIGFDREIRFGGGWGMFFCIFRFLFWFLGMIVKDGMYI